MADFSAADSTAASAASVAARVAAARVERCLAFCSAASRSADSGRGARERVGVLLGEHPLADRVGHERHRLLAQRDGDVDRALQRDRLDGVAVHHVRVGRHHRVDAAHRGVDLLLDLRLGVAAVT